MKWSRKLRNQILILSQKFKTHISTKLRKFPFEDNNGTEEPGAWWSVKWNFKNIIDADPFFFHNFFSALQP